MKDHIKSIQTLRTELTATLKPGRSRSEMWGVEKSKSGGRLKDMFERTIYGYLKRWIFVELVDLWISLDIYGGCITPATSDKLGALCGHIISVLVGTTWYNSTTPRVNSPYFCNFEQHVSLIIGFNLQFRG